MTQYLMSVYMTGDEAEMSEDEMQAVYRQVDEFNAEVQAAGAWVFAGGLHPATSATVVNAKDGDVITTDGPFVETKEQLGGFWVIEAADLDAALGVGGEGFGRVHGRGRGPPFPGRSRHGTRRIDQSCQHWTIRSSAASSGTSPDVRSRRWSVSSATSTSPKRRSRKRSSWRRNAGPSPDCRRTPVRGSRRRPATVPSTGSGASHPAMTDTPKRRSSTSATNHPNRSVP